MDNELLIHILIMLGGVFISSLAQAILKKAALKTYDGFWQQYLNPAVITAYLIFFGATFTGIFAYRRVPLSMGGILESTGYIFITFFSCTMFHEKISARKLAALALIIAGNIVFSLAG